MKKRVISVALLAVLGTMAVGCQKENIVEPQAIVAEIGTVRTVSYTVDGVTQRITLYGEEAWKDFIETMMSLSEEGHNVRFVNENAARCSQAAKETHVFITKDRDAAAAWIEDMGNQGYTVEMTYKDGVYTCIAY